MSREFDPDHSLHEPWDEVDPNPPSDAEVDALLGKLARLSIAECEAHPERIVSTEEMRAWLAQRVAEATTR